jgi:hypothetical protein
MKQLSIRCFAFVLVLGFTSLHAQQGRPIDPDAVFKTHVVHLGPVARGQAATPAAVQSGAVVLNPPRREKSLMAATRFEESRGSTAICSSASGMVVVGVTVGPTLEVAPLTPSLSTTVRPVPGLRGLSPW